MHSLIIPVGTGGRAGRRGCRRRREHGPLHALQRRRLAAVLRRLPRGLPPALHRGDGEEPAGGRVALPRVRPGRQGCAFAGLETTLNPKSRSLNPKCNISKCLSGKKAAPIAVCPVSHRLCWTSTCLTQKGPGCVAVCLFSSSQAEQSSKELPTGLLSFALRMKRHETVLSLLA